MSHFREVTDLLNKELRNIANESKNLTNELNKHSDLKSAMNNYRVIDADKLHSLALRLQQEQERGRRIDKVFTALVNNGAILRSQDVSRINYFLLELFDRLPEHIQEEWKDAFQEVEKCLASGRGLL